MNDLLIIKPETSVLPEGALWWERQVVAATRLLPGMKKFRLSRSSRKAFEGSTWTLVGYGTSQLARLTTTVLLAHLLLGPKAFGLVALVNVFLSGLEMLSDLGVGLDVVQDPRGDELSFLNTAFIIQAARGLILATIAAALAYPFAVFYKQPAVLWLLIVGAASIAVRGFTSSSVWTMTRHVQLKRLTLLTISGEIAGLVASLTWAIVAPSAWALVVGKVASALIFVVGTHMVANHPVSTVWDSRAAKHILAFGTGIFLSTSTYFLTGEAERLVVGKFVNLVELGCFSLALTISAAATTGFVQIINQVFFPLIAEAIREDKDRAERKFGHVRHLVLLISASLAVGFIVGSRWIVALLLGPKYAMTGWILQLLGLRASIQLFIGINSSMLFAVGTSRYQAWGNTAKLVVLTVGLWIAFGRYGFRAATWVLALSPLAVYVSLMIGFYQYFRKLVLAEVASFGAFLSCVALSAGIVLLAR